MLKITTYNCGQINGQKLFIPDLREYLQSEDSYLHFIRGTLLCFCRRGEATIKVNYNTYTLNANEMLAILPTHVICIENSTEDAVIEALLYSDDYWVSLAHSVDYKLLKIVEHSPYLRLDDESCTEVFSLLDLIKKHEDNDDTNTDIERYMAGGLAFALLMLLVSLLGKNHSYAPRPVTRKEMLTHDFFELLSQHYETQRQVAFYASKLCVTPKHLSTMVKEVTHLSLQEWINSVTVLNIKRRLLTTTDTIQQISEDLNFQTPSTFIRYFRQHAGITPSRYRTEHQIRRR